MKNTSFLKLGLFGCSLLLASPAFAQESLILGSSSGKITGQAAFLASRVIYPSQPVRAGLLPLAEDSLGIQAQLLESLKANNTMFQWRLIPTPDEPESANYNLAIVKLATQQKLDVIAVPSLKKIEKGYWLIVDFFSGAGGKLLSSQKVSLTTAQQLNDSQQLTDSLQSLNLSLQLNDVADSGNHEIRLQTSPENMHVYIDQTLVGLSPLILRQVPLESQQLKIFEQAPYQISRIRILSTPPGVEIQVNGKTVGKTPMDFPPEIRAPGEFEIGFVSPAEFQAEIQVQTEPEGLPVQLNDTLIQRTPVSFQRLDQNNYRLWLPAYRPIEITYPLNMNNSLQEFKIDAYKYSKLIINASENNAEIHLNQEIIGETPFSANLAQGLHQLEVHKQRFRSQSLTLNLQPGKTHEYFFDLQPRSADTSIFLTPTGEITPQLNIAGKYLGFGQLTRTNNNTTDKPFGHLYGLEVDYGWPQLYEFSENFALGLEVSAAFFGLQMADSWLALPSLGTKLQFLRESDIIPISAAFGSYLSLNPAHLKAVGFLSLSRNFGDFALHLGLQTHGFNINLGYTGWDNLRLGLLVYADSFFRFLSSSSDESWSTFYGLQLGYSF